MHTINKQYISCHSHLFSLTRLQSFCNSRESANHGQKKNKKKQKQRVDRNKGSSVHPHHFSIISFKVQQQSVRQRRGARNLSKLCVSRHWNVYVSLKKETETQVNTQSLIAPCGWPTYRTQRKVVSSQLSNRQWDVSTVLLQELLPTCCSLSFSCRVIRCLFFLAPAAWCCAADEEEPGTPFSQSWSSPASESTGAPGSS